MLFVWGVVLLLLIYLLLLIMIHPLGLVFFFNFLTVNNFCEDVEAEKVNLK